MANTDVRFSRADRSAVLTELRRLHRANQDLSFTAQRGSDLYSAANRQFGNYRAAIEAAGIDYESVWRRRFTKWNEQTICDSLRKLSRRKLALNSRSLRESHPPLFGAAVHWFGSYRAAIEAAGLDYTRVRRQEHGRWNRESIVRELRKLKREHVPLHHNAIRQHHPELMVASYRYFGTYERAIVAAGIDYDTVRIRPQQKWDNREIVAELKRLHRSGSGLWARAIRHSNSYLPRIAKDKFGSFNAAARAAGIPADALKPPPYRLWSRDHVLEVLKKIGSKNVQALAPTRLRDRQSYLVRAASQRFGSYRAAVQAAGFDYEAIARVYAPSMSAEQVVERLKVLQERGKDLRYSVLGKSEPRLLNAARRRFGTYAAAVRKAGIAYPPPTPLRHWTEKLVLNTLKDMHARGEDLRYRPTKKSRLPLYEAARHYFGSYTNAVRVAEIGYGRMATTQRHAEKRQNRATYLAKKRAR